VVGTDNAAGGRIAVDHLVASGATSLAFLGDTTGIEIADRLRGATDAATAAGLPIRHIPIPLATDAMGPEIEAAMASQCSGIDGVVAASDLVAMAALRCLHQKGLRVPEDVQIVGFDDLPLSAQTVPPLTTIRQEIATGARAMVERLRALVEKEPATSLVMPPTLIVRQSTRAEG